MAAHDRRPVINKASWALFWDALHQRAKLVLSVTIPLSVVGIWYLNVPGRVVAVEVGMVEEVYFIAESADTRADGRAMILVRLDSGLPIRLPVAQPHLPVAGEEVMIAQRRRFFIGAGYTYEGPANPESNITLERTR